MTNGENKGEETDQSLAEHSRFRPLTYPFKVMIFPFRALKEIAHSQDFMSVLPGFLLVIALNTAIFAGTAYLKASKIFLDSGTHSASLLEADFMGALLSSLLQNLLGLVLSWVTYAGILFLLARFFGKKRIASSIFLTVVGYAFSVLVIYGAITALLVSFLPELHFEARVWELGTAEEINNIYNSVWGTTLAYRLLDYLGLVFMFWVVFLGAIIVRVSQEISLMMAIILSFTAYFAGNMLIAIVSLLI